MPKKKAPRQSSGQGGKEMTIRTGAVMAYRTYNRNRGLGLCRTDALRVTWNLRLAIMREARRAQPLALPMGRDQDPSRVFCDPKLNENGLELIANPGLSRLQIKPSLEQNPLFGKATENRPPFAPEIRG